MVLLMVAIFCGPHFAFAQSWAPTGAPDFFWMSIASSADGSKLAAVEGGDLMGPICTSTNSGSTWVTNSAPYLYWSSIASSADGTKLVAAVYGGGIFTSIDSGADWTSNSAPFADWQSVASSADGTMLAAVIDAGEIYLSTNSGAVWNPSLAPVAGWKSITSSADGTKLAAASYDAGIYLSTDSGNTWAQATNTPGAGWLCIASSADGGKLAATTGLSIYVSTNSGMTWIPASNGSFVSVACSADGTKLVSADSGGGIYTSADSGFDWVTNNAPTGFEWNWQCVASSADGGKLAATYDSGLYEGGIWTAQTVQSPNMNISTPGNAAKLSWTIPSTNFVLQQCSSLASGDWTTVTNTPVLNLTNLQDEVVLSPVGSSLFYRLKTP